MKKTINNLAVYDFGNKRNPSIIFVHGFPYDHHMWHNQIEALKDKYYCVAYDIRGFGESKIGDGQYTMEMFVDDLFTVIKKMKLSKPVLCGMSMGGYISLRAIERDQSIFKAVILCDTKAEADTNDGKLKRAAAIKQINENGAKKFVESFIKNCFSDITLEENRKVYLDTLSRSKKSKTLGLKGALLAMAGRTDTTTNLPKINIPTLLIVGSFDTLTPPNVMREMTLKIKSSEFGIAPGAGHMAPLENPGFVNDMITGFLNNQ
ncbi:MAG: alpha/beta hydrolase [Ignavibacteria bacterium RBG_13_36_8]|nr:MAG: alpha/beta hydrolase [Ignavibacteria bacterium RBG_13_36_8]